MRKIEAEAKQAFFDGKKLSKSNTTIEISEWAEIGKVSKYYLFGNLIAEFFHKTKMLRVMDAGWKTATTKSRINSLLPHNVWIYQEKGTWYFQNWAAKREVFTGSKTIYLS